MSKLIENKLYHISERLIFRVVCAPKDWSKEKVLEENLKKFGAPGTSAGWIISKDENLPDGDTNPIKCDESDSRVHWALNC